MLGRKTLNDTAASRYHSKKQDAFRMDEENQAERHFERTASSARNPTTAAPAADYCGVSGFTPGAANARDRFPARAARARSTPAARKARGRAPRSGALEHPLGTRPAG